MIKFEKVSRKQFIDDCMKTIPCTEEEAGKWYDNVKLPTRGSSKAAGYDFYTPIPFEIKTPNSDPVAISLFGYKPLRVTIPTGIRVAMSDDTFLMIVPRSGVGFKTGVSLANTCGVIDADYYNSPNEGHVFIKFVSGFNDYNAAVGDRVAQGIFMKYYTTDDDDTKSVRSGGFGSTGK